MNPHIISSEKLIKFNRNSCLIKVTAIAIYTLFPSLMLFVEIFQKKSFSY